ncbi:LacI family DNA-binding transcriptional regulator [Spirochaeta africana]|uniref:Transcriptional regulator n=1 Tax=Spirochaeta africana (strain ATCC 700263 / DSM 8902 / Z-7692) TaxID=889378 RepID=H9UGY9_SPIAZ|nr:LacI family DNA-binding transcriptional regulator [Spirochaeta africana]AFG36782.1 transcriptional regulator [Spirochaeta africana DSM 8902]
MKTIKDVAAAAGVSTATVSRVLSNSSKVSDSVRQRVHEAIAQLDYRPNRVARSLRAQKSNVIGLIVADIQNPYFTLVSRAVQDAAYMNGYNIFLCNTDEKEDKERQYLDIMYDENVAGIIISPTHDIRQTSRLLAERHIPAVIIDRANPELNLSSVTIDNHDAGYRLTRHILQSGKTNPVLIAGSGSTTGKLRSDGFCTALSEFGIPIHRDTLHFIQARDTDGYAAVGEILKNRPNTDAIIATNGLIAAGAFRRLHELGIMIPEHVAFACIDETMWTPLVTPAITVMRQPTQEIGARAVDLLLAQIENTQPDQTIAEVLHTTLIPRHST